MQALEITLETEIALEITLEVTLEIKERLETGQWHRAYLVFSTFRIPAPYKSNASLLTGPLEILCGPQRLFWNGQIGDLAGNGIEGCLEGKGQAHQRTMPIEDRRNLLIYREGVDSVHVCRQPRESGRTAQDHLPARGVNHAHVAEELKGIAQALLGMKQNARAVERLPAPDRLGEAPWSILFPLVTDFITAPARGIVPFQQIEQTQIPSDIDRFRLQSKSPIEALAGFRQLALFALRIAKVVVRLCRIRLELECSLVACDGIFEPAKIPQGVPQIVESLRGVRP